LNATFNVTYPPNTGTFYGNEGRCPTGSNEKISFSLDFSSSNPRSIVATGPNIPMYFSFDPGYSSTTGDSFTATVTTAPIQCEDPQGLRTCKQYVHWPTSTYNAGDVEQAENVIVFVVALFGAANEASCLDTFVNILCASVFPKCDSNNFPIPPCAHDCEILAEDCKETFSQPGVTGSANCSVAGSTDSYCYLSGAPSVGFNNYNAFLVIAMLFFIKFF